MSFVSPSSIFDTGEYRRKRATQAGKATAMQFERLANIARGIKPEAIRNRLGGQPLPPPLPDHTVNVFPPYTSGSPNPLYGFNSTTGQVQDAGPGISEFALGNEKLGRIALGAYGGINLWGILAPLTGEWLFGDATAVSASLYETRTVFNVDWPRKATDLICVVDLSNPLLLPQFGQTGAIICIAGKPNSALGGFVGVSGVLDVTATLFSPEGALLVSETFSQIFLELAVNAQKPGTFDGPIVDPGVFLSLDWLFDTAPDRTIQTAVSVPLNLAADRLVINPTVVVEATVRIVAGRGGIRDPDGGSFTFDFPDEDNHADPFGGTDGFFTVPRIILDPGFWPPN